MSNRKKRNMYINANSLRTIEPLTDNQTKLFEAYQDGKNVFASGVAGSGKTFLMLYLAIKEVFDKTTKYEKVIITRSLLPSRDIGFLPGTLDEKSDLYKDAYRLLVRYMFELSSDQEFDKLYDMLEGQGTIQFISTSFLRGLTFDNSIIICDEMQNMLFHELDTLISRVGQDSKIMFAGDQAQTDLRNGQREGLDKFRRILETMHEDFALIEMDYGDIVRSGLVRNYLIAKTNWYLTNQE